LFGGGVASVEQARKIISLGVEKVALSSAALLRPDLVSQVASELGRQSVVVVLDVKKRRFSREYDVFIHNGTKNMKQKVVDTAIMMESLGVGELVVNCIDNDGMMEGYNISLAETVRKAINIPMTVLGGAGNLEDITSLVRCCGIVGAAAGSMFVFKGKYRAVLINYPSTGVRDKLLDRLGK